MSTIYSPKKIIYSPNDPFFEEGNIALRSIWLQKEAQSASEINIIRQETTELVNKFTIEIYCDECRVQLPSISAYENHYEAIHRNVCSVCFKIFPGSDWLKLHLDECHDIFTKMKKERGEKIHTCFVNTCDKSFSTPKMRRLHLKDKHGYPKYFPFDLVYTGTLSFEARKNKEQKQKAQQQKQQQQQPKQDLDTIMTELTENMSKLKLPKSISFGHQPKALPRNTKSKKQVDVDMEEKRVPRKRGPKKKKPVENMEI